MYGTPATNAVICIPGVSTLEYRIGSYAFTSIVSETTAGTTAMSCSQTGGNTTMTWSRQASNGNAADAQISLTGPTRCVQ